jgi:hypothetical protein
MSKHEAERTQIPYDLPLTCLNSDCRTVWFSYSNDRGDRCPSCGCIGVDDPVGNEPASDAVEQEWKRLNPGVRTRRDFRIRM